MESLLDSASPTSSAPLAIDPVGLLFRHKFKSFTSFLAIIAGTLGFTAMSSPTYKSEAQIKVRLGRESMAVDPTATTGQFIIPGDTRESEVNAFFEVVNSEAVRAKVVEEIGAEEILGSGGITRMLSKITVLNDWNLNPFRIYNLDEKAMMLLDKKLKLRTSKSNDVVKLSFESYSNEVARDVLDAVIRHSKNKHLEVNRVEGSNKFFNEQADVLEARLRDLDEKIRTFKTENGLASLADQREVQIRQIGALQDDAARVYARKAAAEAEISKRRSELARLPATIEAEVVSNMPTSAIDSMDEEVYKLSLREKELMARYQDEHPLIVQIRDQIERARKATKSEQDKPQITKRVNQWREDAAQKLRDREADLVALTTEYTSLKSELDAARGAISQLNEQELTLRQLERDRDIADTAYRKYQDNREQTRIDVELRDQKISNINIQQEPTMNDTPSSPNVLLNLALGGVLSTLGAVGAAVWGENRLAKRQREAARLAARTPTPPALQPTQMVLVPASMAASLTAPMMVVAPGTTSFSTPSAAPPQGATSQVMTSPATAPQPSVATAPTVAETIASIRAQVTNSTPPRPEPPETYLMS